MGVPPLTDEQCLEAVDAFILNEGNKSKAAKSLKLPNSTFNARLERAAKRGFLGTQPVLPGFEIKQTSAQVGPDGEVQKEWVQQRPMTGEEFELLPNHMIKGVSALLDPQGRIIQQWLKTKAEPTMDDVTIAIKAAFSEYDGKAVKFPTSRTDKDEETATIYPISDHHLGMYAWKDESGEDYDLSIADKLLRDTMAQLVSLSQPSQQAVILNLGDFFHSDSNENRTRRSGVALDVDTRYAKVLQAGVSLMIHTIELALSKHETVLVRNLQGNHDPYAALALSIALAAFFSDHPRVTVDTSPNPFFFWEFGKVLIGSTHGDMAKPEDMVRIMAAKMAEAWGRTKYRYAYMGHVHRKGHGGGDLGGATWETFQTLAAKDAWSNSMGFSSGRSMQSITHHREKGEVARVTVNVRGPA